MKSLEERLTDLELRFAAILPKQEEPEQEEPMLECTGGGWRTRNTVSNASYQNLGIEHETETESIEAGKRRIQQEIINNHATRLNKEDGYIADWKDEYQVKCCMAFDHPRGLWNFNYLFERQPTGDVAMSEQSAIYLQEKLNKGLITGVNANGDI